MTDAFLTAGGSGIHRPLGRSQDVGADYKSKVNEHNNLTELKSVLVLGCLSEHLFLTLTERKRRCKEKRKAGSLCVHPSEERPAQPQVRGSTSIQLYWFVGSDWSLKFCFTLTGSEPNCTASSRAWWEVPRRGRSLEGKFRRKKGKPEEDHICCWLDCYCNVCNKNKTDLGSVCFKDALMILNKLFLHSMVRKGECHAEYTPSGLLLKLKKKNNMVSNGLASLKIYPKDQVHGDNSSVYFHCHIWPLEGAAHYCIVNCE